MLGDMKTKCPPEVKTSNLIETAGDVRAIADVLGISTQAVYAWGILVPSLRVYQLMALKPEWFKKAKV